MPVGILGLSSELDQLLIFLGGPWLVRFALQFCSLLRRSLRKLSQSRVRENSGMARKARRPGGGHKIHPLPPTPPNPQGLAPLRGAYTRWEVYPLRTPYFATRPGGRCYVPARRGLAHS